MNKQQLVLVLFLALPTGDLVAMSAGVRLFSRVIKQIRDSAHDKMTDKCAEDRPTQVTISASNNQLYSPSEGETSSSPHRIQGDYEYLAEFEKRGHLGVHVTRITEQKRNGVVTGEIIDGVYSLNPQHWPYGQGQDLTANKIIEKVNYDSGNRSVLRHDDGSNNTDTMCSPAGICLPISSDRDDSYMEEIILKGSGSKGSSLARDNANLVSKKWGFSCHYIANVSHQIGSQEHVTYVNEGAYVNDKAWGHKWGSDVSGKVVAGILERPFLTSHTMCSNYGDKPHPLSLINLLRTRSQISKINQELADNNKDEVTTICTPAGLCIPVNDKEVKVNMTRITSPVHYGV